MCYYVLGSEFAAFSDPICHSIHPEDEMGKTEGKKGGQSPEGFTLGLALADAVPVIEFAAVMAIISLRYTDTLFVCGAVCAVVAGCGKVAWKILLAWKNRNIERLNTQFRSVMVTGAFLMLASLIMNENDIDIAAVFYGALVPPACIFFALGIAGIIALFVCGEKLDAMDPKSNWICEIVNIATWACFLAGVLLY